jgi:putative hemolysin
MQSGGGGIAGDLLTLGLICLLLITSGLFSAAEISFLAMGRRRAHRVADGRAGAMVQRLRANPAALLGVMLVTITAVNYTAEAVAASWVIERGLPVAYAIVGMAVVVMIFAEVVPISYGAANPERVARAMAVPVWLASKVLSLPARGVGFLADIMARCCGGRAEPAAPVTEGEIRAIVDLQAETGDLEQEEKAMIHQIFEFGERVAREVMVPRTDMVAISAEATAGEAAQSATEHRISRLPVYQKNLDHIVGVVHVKDVLPLLASEKGDTPVSAVLRQPLRVPETKNLSDLLTEFQRRRRSLAIVVDEYGGTAGVVTLEDLLEEVVGDIYDEYDVVRPSVERVGGGAITLDGRMSIEDASKAIGAALPDGDYDSVAGLLYSHLGMVPQVGQRLALEGIALVVEHLDGHRITRVRAVREPATQEDGDN